jgi:acyltransferase
MMKNPLHIDWVDHARAFGICLVVLGHTAGLPDFITQLIYSFHMPLFFFISGYLLKDSYLSLPSSGFLRRLWKKLLVPYICFWAISYLYWLVTHNLVFDPTKYAGLSFTDLFAGFLFGTGDTDHTLYIINVDLWFFTCLFSTALIYYILRRWLKGVSLLFAIVLLGGFAPLLPHILGFRLPWNFDLAGAALVFFGLGHLLQKEQLPSKKILGWVGLLVLPGWVLLVWLNGPVDMNTMQFGRLWLFYLGAGAGIFLTVALSHWVPNNRLSCWLSANTIVIFPLHQLMFSFFNGVFVLVLGLPLAFKTTLFASILYSSLAIALCVPVAYLIRRYAPFMIGERRRIRG